MLYRTKDGTIITNEELMYLNAMTIQQLGIQPLSTLWEEWDEKKN